MRELVSAEVGIISGGLVGSPIPGQLASGLPGCDALPSKLELVCNILGGDVIAGAVWAGVNAFGQAINAQAQTNPLPPTTYAPGYGPPSGDPSSPNFVGPPAPPTPPGT